MRFLVPTAGTGPARKNADYILTMARNLKAEVIAIHILDPLQSGDDGQKALEIFEQKGKDIGVVVKTKTIEGNVVPTIVDTAEEEKANLIIMGGSSGALVAEWIVTDVLAKSTVPVVIIPYQG